MSHPRKYGGPNEYDLAELALWINQIEDISGCSVSIGVNKAIKMTVLTVDLDTPKPGPAKIQMGHLPVDGTKPIKGQAYVVGQIVDVTVYR